MDRSVVLFLKAGLVWLVLGVTLGLGMAVHPPFIAWRTAHIHMLLVGFVTGMIFGVGYHVFPRFAGRPLRHPRLVLPHWWLGNLGVGALASGFVFRAEGFAWSPAILATGGAAAALGAYLFAYNIWRTIGASSLPRPAPLGTRGSAAGGGGTERSVASSGSRSRQPVSPPPALPGYTAMRRGGSRPGR